MSDSVRGRSKALFNNAYVLDVARAIGAGDEVVDSKTLQQRLSLGQSTVQRVLVTLEGVGLVERLERRTRTEPQQYRRVAHSFWAAAGELADA
ncbi:helix-turn-helix domain-containing protein [Clavibacter michiganensis]|uniref:helix-turn-helix domain-containing protein n=1 Tax=Clavibacter michiganensis TaxID=28447 RepID=UPI0011B006A7|nr:helix-turn-helix domain-containing protein [Clavibacter michiganensis]